MWCEASVLTTDSVAYDRHKRWRERHLEQSKEIHRRWEAKNKDKRRAQRLHWQRNNKDKVSVHNHRRYAKNPQSVKDQVWRSKLRRFYGLTVEQWNAMNEAQGGVCALCFEPCKKNKRLTVDHCHITSVVRGLLCCACNLAIGKFRDDYELIERAASYLKKHAVISQARAV